MLRYMTIRFGSVLIVVGLIIGGLQIALRAVNGYWPRWRLSLFVGGNQPHWPSYPGAEHAAASLLAFPLSFSILAAGIFALLVGTLIWSAFSRG